MTSDQVVLIGGSAGAIPSILEICRNLPKSFTVPICIVIHMHPDSKSALPMLLESASGISSKHAEDQDILEPRTIYVAPPDRHMLLEGGRIFIHRGAHENRSRPAIDPLFRSAALTYGTNVVAVLLSGYLDDGAAGLLAVKREGGRIIVQDPNDTIYGDMPANALEVVRADFVLPLQDIPRAIVQMAERIQGIKSPRPSALEVENAEENVRTNVANGDGVEYMQGKPSTFSCPQCSGSLWEIQDGQMIRYRCHEGHAYAPKSLIAGQNDALENALWTALRALDDKIALQQRLLRRAEQLDQHLAARKYMDTIEHTDVHAHYIRQILKTGSGNLFESQPAKKTVDPNEAVTTM